MSENSIPNLSNIAYGRASPAGQPAEQAAAMGREVKARPSQVEQKAHEQPASSPQAPSDVSLKFMVDEKTRDVTILILDRASHKVVRTIPPEEMSELDPGELLQLFA